MLEDYGVYFYAEPCPWEDFEATKRVADALEKVLVAGGEQDTSYFQEFNGAPQAPPAWLEPELAPRAGAIAVPAGPGLGVTVDPDFLKKAEKVSGVAK